jgi:hypothetical protein
MNSKADNFLLQSAERYLAAGFSILPTGNDKRPTLSEWTPYQREKASSQQVKEWFFNGTRNLAVIGGAVSGNLEVIDFDCDMEGMPEWERLVNEEAPGLLEKLYFETSPHGGHIVYRCLPEITIPGNSKLAEKLVEVVGPGLHPHPYKGEPKLEAKQYQGKWIIAPDLIETRGTGGYCLVAPSKGYVSKHGDLCTLPVLTQEERDLLIDTARSLNEVLPEVKQPKAHEGGKQASGQGLLPGQDYDERGDLRALLQKHGWTFKGHSSDGREKWARPGKERGKVNSATLTDGKVLYVFSSNAHPFEVSKGYGPFAVYATLEHGGDFSAASKALAAQGYGEKQGSPDALKASAGGAPTMADLKMFIDMAVDAGQFFTTEQVCRGLGAYTREHKKHIYTGLSRLTQEGVIKKDPYRHGGFRRPLQIGAYDMGGEIEQNPLVDIKLPLEIQNFVTIERNQLVCVAGRYDAGKSSFLYHTMRLNYRTHKVVHFSSPEWELNAIKKRMDDLGIERPHPNVFCYPMLEGYEDLIPDCSCIVLVDYIRTQDDPRDIDRQFYRILQNLKGGVALAAIQKHPGQDKPTGGQFAVHAPHHVILLDKMKEDGAYICKFFKVKGSQDLEGYFRVFGFGKKGRYLTPYMDTWKKGEIKWSKPKDNNDNDDNQANKK